MFGILQQQLTPDVNVTLSWNPSSIMAVYVAAYVTHYLHYVSSTFKWQLVGMILEVSVMQTYMFLTGSGYWVLDYILIRFSLGSTSAKPITC